MEKVYFAHPVNVFGTELKTEIMPVLRTVFKRIQIEDPDQPHHQKGYADWKKRLEGNPNKSGGMSYYYDEVLPACDRCVAMPFLDGMYGAGVAGEAKFFIERGGAAFILTCSAISGWRVYAMSRVERECLMRNDPMYVLSIEETRARTWMSPEGYNRVKRPYETAHEIDFDPSQWTTEYLKSIKK